MTRRYLQDRESKLFFHGIADWRATAEGALNFVSTPAAAKFCEFHGLENMQVVLRFSSDPQYDVQIPLTVSSGPREGLLSALLAPPAPTPSTAAIIYSHAG